MSIGFPNKEIVAAYDEYKKHVALDQLKAGTLTPGIVEQEAYYIFALGYKAAHKKFHQDIDIINSFDKFLRFPK